VWPNGIGVGFAAVFGVTRLLDSMLFGVTPLDPATFLLVPLALAAVATLTLAHAALNSEKLPQSRVIDACSTFRPDAG
jgi:putative ABC transport system permease protein